MNKLENEMLNIGHIWRNKKFPEELYIVEYLGDKWVVYVRIKGELLQGDIELIRPELTQTRDEFLTTKEPTRIVHIP